MKKFLQLLGIVAMTTTAYGQADTDIVNIPDETFKNALLSHHIDTNGDREISYEEARAYTGKIEIRDKYIITSLKGIETFVNLTGLDCSHNLLTSLDVSKNTALIELRCYNNKLTSIDVSKNTALTLLYCANNQLTSLNVNGATALRNLNCSNNKLTSIDVSKNTALAYLSCYNNQLTSIDVSKNTALAYLSCSNNQLTSIDVSKNTALAELSCYNNQLTILDVSKNTALTHLDCSNNQLSLINLANGNNATKTNNKKLKYVYLKENPNLRCIQVDYDFYYDTSNLLYTNLLYTWQKDARSRYSYDCNFPVHPANEKEPCKKN